MTLIWLPAFSWAELIPGSALLGSPSGRNETSAESRIASSQPSAAAAEGLPAEFEARPCSSREPLVGDGAGERTMRDSAPRQCALDCSLPLAKTLSKLLHRGSPYAVLLPQTLAFGEVRSASWSGAPLPSPGASLFIFRRRHDQEASCPARAAVSPNGHGA